MKRANNGAQPEAGAVYGGSARTDLRGGWRVTAIPTATIFDKPDTPHFPCFPHIFMITVYMFRMGGWPGLVS